MQNTHVINQGWCGSSIKCSETRKRRSSVRGCVDFLFLIDIGEFGVYTNLDKTMVIQEAQAFNESPLNYRKCNLILAKFLYLLYQSEPLTAKEATNIFFAVTKSFQCKDVWS